ncbi:unnamed protein product [Rotaria sp. Silwood1]|nr:unnamed protein product [Rotaria sp. Silwood1]CAF1315675.1 unnamed protein product [Rotaria sp. Silwood1]CAF3592498.1 unnamed protein product [Rotaria sp. Silwood1]CAF4691756.1 unnamed protein product [Rotaria sp. Silwood1]CAF4871718.1 unnamed protein product [Rotaria sp. Silwood1]
MKRSSSSLDQQLTNNDDKIHQESYAKMVRRSSSRSEFNNEEKNQYNKQTTAVDQRVEDKTSYWLPRYSLILGSFSEPPTYVIHFLDSHLTFLQSFQICSLFGRVRIHGYTLHPLTFYSVYNYRTNSPVSIEFINSETTIPLLDIKSLISDIQLADNALLNVEQKGGDILLIRKESNNDSLFIKTMREHQFYKNWFSENYNLFERDNWKQLEQNLHIRLIETTDQIAVIPRKEFVSTADHIINRWLNVAVEDSPFIVLICGEKDMGKSTFIRYLTNRALDHISSTFSLTYFDCDIGQCEFSIGGCLSYVNLDSPLLGPPCSHIKSNPKPDRLLYYGLLSPQTSPVRYLQYINKLRQIWNIDQKNGNQKRSMILINTMGWGTGLGLEILKETICMCCPKVVIQLGDNMISSQNRNKMPDLTLEWLLQQSVYVPYRQQIQMNNRRQQDYDGQLNYEYIKMQSAAVSNRLESNTSKLRARDHRLLATWSYFFSSSNLSYIHLPWSQLVHVSLLDNKNKNSIVIPDSLERSMVALCSSEKIDQLRNSAVSINETFQLLNYQDEIFECLGFAWIKHCNKETRNYEIYTPVNCLTNINLLVIGAFDTPDEFQYMFSRVNL